MLRPWRISSWWRVPSNLIKARRFSAIEIAREILAQLGLESLAGRWFWRIYRRKFNSTCFGNRYRPGRLASVAAEIPTRVSRENRDLAALFVPSRPVSPSPP